jgi:hypothetical protein
VLAQALRFGELAQDLPGFFARHVFFRILHGLRVRQPTAMLY